MKKSKFFHFFISHTQHSSDDSLFLHVNVVVVVVVFHSVA